MKKKRICGSAPKLGFTLAEILITLSIIGVVAALTIPTLIQRTGNEELVSRLYKAYSTLSQATEAIMTEQGAANVWAVNVDNIYEAYKAHLRNSRDCGSGIGCFSRELDGYAAIKRLDGEIWGGYNSDNINFRKLILSDGTSISFPSADSGCGIVHFAAGLKDMCGLIIVDINGSKKPNILGRDIFYFGLKKDGLYPGGVDDTEANYANTCNKAAIGEEGGKGQGCAARVIAEGDMNY